MGLRSRATSQPTASPIARPATASRTKRGAPPAREEGPDTPAAPPQLQGESAPPPRPARPPPAAHQEDGMGRAGGVGRHGERRHRQQHAEHDEVEAAAGGHDRRGGAHRGSYSRVSVATARAATPSPRPTNPIPSPVDAL